MRSARVTALAPVFLLLGCGTVPLPSVQPPPSSQPPPSVEPTLPVPPAIQAVGILEDERIADPVRTYVLVDGRTFEITTNVTRVLFEGGPGHPFIIGSDASGPFVAVFAHQDGTPDDCHIVPAGGPGIERGRYVEIKGILWKKALDFHSDVQPPAVGQEWPGARFCFNERAEIATVIP